YTVVGRIIPLKRIETIVESFQNITSDNIKILIVGDGDPKYITAIQGLIKSRNLKDKFVFVGHLSNPYAVIKKSKGVILCSESEGFPNILVEALCLGKPIIASDCISGPREILCINGKLGRNEIIKNEFGILYPVGDALALAKAINYMNENHTTF
ncbi:glycosyltransferase, partial [Escherichia coli]|nr:glycosyltransferase [Escherichia coli]